MPIFFACDSEEQAKDLCRSMHGEYKGRSFLYLGSYTWETHAGCCVTTFVKINGGEFDRYMVVFNTEADAFETIQIAGPAVSSTFVKGGSEDAPAELKARYVLYRYAREEAREQAKSMLRNKARALEEARLRRIKGKSVVVNGGTTIKHGTTGVVFWVGHGEKGDARVGFKDIAEKRHFIALKYVIEANDLPLLAQAS